MRFRFNIGKRFGRLSDEEKRVLERLKKREITIEQAEHELGGHLRVTEARFTLGESAGREAAEDSASPTEETADERTARELVERIAREVDAETAR